MEVDEELLDSDNESAFSDDSEASSEVEERRRQAAALIIGLAPVMILREEPTPINNSVHTARDRRGAQIRSVGPRPEIAGDPEFSPFFDDIDGALDGTQCSAFQRRI
jgi:hypothetical protein